MASFDPNKDELNVAKHGVSLARADDLEVLATFEDNRFAYGETRYRAFGHIDGKTYCLVYTLRDGEVRAVSLRRAHEQEMKRYVP